jgi:putative SOS response-associated peptidase YedK
MCGRFVLANPGAAVARFKLVPTLETRLPIPRFNIAPTQEVMAIVPPVAGGAEPAVAPSAGERFPVLVQGADGRRLTMMRWGYAPAWLGKAGRGKPQINARSETLLDRPMFRGALASRRCIIPADGFYEWTKPPDGGKKQPVHIRLRGGRPFGFAGIFVMADDDELTCAILTCEPNAVMAELHHRMPCILQPADEDLWLDPAVTDPVALLACLQPYPAEEMEAYPVSDEVNSSRGEGAQLLLPLEA